MRHCSSISVKSSSRRKSCQQCAVAKARCDLQRPRCSRCLVKGGQCDFAVAPEATRKQEQEVPLPLSPGLFSPNQLFVDAAIGNDPDSSWATFEYNDLDHIEQSVPSLLSLQSATPLLSQTEAATCVGGEDSSISDNYGEVTQSQLVSSRHPFFSCEAALRKAASTVIEPADSSFPTTELPTDPLEFDFGNANQVLREAALAALFDPNRGSDDIPIKLQGLRAIRDRWMCLLNTAVSKTCTPHKPTVEFYGQILQTYPGMMAHKTQLPPIIHPLQLSARVTPLPLANCFSLVRLWEDRVNGSEQLAEDTVRREMQRLFDEVRHVSSLYSLSNRD